jgi:hypothetical protein
VIPFHTWLSQVVGYCHFVADDRAVRRAWVNRDYSQTSITDFDELYEQIFDDMDSDALEKDLSTYLPDDSGARDDIATFLQQIREISDQQEQGGLRSAADLLDSKAWGRLVDIARRVKLRSPFPGLGSDGRDAGPPAEVEVAVDEQSAQLPQAVPEVYAALKPWEAVAIWIAWIAGPGSFLLSMWMRDRMPAWLGPGGPLLFVSLVLTIAVGRRRDVRRTPEFWLLVIYLAGWGVPLLGLKLGISFLVFVVPFAGVAAIAAAFAFPIMGVLRLAAHLRRCSGRTRPG